VPNGATTFFIAPVAGGVGINTLWGVTTSSGSAWMRAESISSTTNDNNPGSAGISSTTVTGNASNNLYDGSYATYGYFQISGGYLQFVCVAAGAASTTAGNTLYWGVS
jgi:hypothetical protein